MNLITVAIGERFIELVILLANFPRVLLITEIGGGGTTGYDTLQIKFLKSQTLPIQVQLGWQLVKGEDFSQR